MEVTRHFILNLALLLVILYLFQSWHESRKNTSIPNWAVFIYFLLAIIISLMLSIKINGDFQFDLRQVPLIVGGVYLGKVYSLLLLIGTLFARSFHGINLGFWVATIIYFIQTLIVIGIFKKFHRMPTIKRIGTTVIISLFSSLCFIVFLNLRENPLTVIEWTSFILSSAVGAGILTATIETWRKNRFLSQQIMKTEKIEAISQMSAAISHEVRNPLTAVRGFLQLLKDKSFDETKRTEFIEIALHEIMRAENIINDYLTFAKPSLDRMDEIDVAKELNQAINIIKAFANLHAIEVAVTLQPNIYIMGDHDRFKQCLVNIMKNGTEAMPAGGTLTISCSQNQDQACIIIGDTGIGMTNEQLERLGEPYYSTKGSNGTGLGMMVSHGIIRAMNGKIFAESVVGEGTTFYLTLPLKMNKEANKR